MASARRPVQLILFHHLRPCRRAFIRCIASSSARNSNPPPLPQREKNWLTRKVETSPFARKVFLALAKSLGYGSPRQMAGRRALVLYENVCAPRPDEDKAFWQTGTCTLATN